MDTITVAICTHNRAAFLAKALDSLVPYAADTALSILVVDNASTDTTAALTQEYQTRLPMLRYIHEPRLGLSYARNTAIDQASGAWLIYLDDDAVALSGWLEAYRAVIAAQPKAGVIGGRVLPLWGAPRPAWLDDSLAGYYSVYDAGADTRQLLPGQCAIGANIAFKLEPLRTLGGFSAALGRKGAALISGEEILVQRRFAAAGYTSWYCGLAAVRHYVPAERLTQDWLLRRAAAEGVSGAIMWRLEARPSAAARLRRWLHRGRRYGFSWLRAQLRGGLEAQQRAALQRGYLKGLWTGL